MKPWTLDDLAVVRSIYESGARWPARDAARLLGRTANAVKTFASRAGLTRAHTRETMRAQSGGDPCES